MPTSMLSHIDKSSEEPVIPPGISSWKSSDSTTLDPAGARHVVARFRVGIARTLSNHL